MIPDDHISCQDSKHTIKFDKKKNNYPLKNLLKLLLAKDLNFQEPVLYIFCVMGWCMSWGNLDIKDYFILEP